MFSFPGSLPGSRRRRSAAASFLHNHRNQERYFALCLCHNHAHHKQNVEGRSFILLFVRHLSRMPEFVVGGGEEVNRKWLYYSELKWEQRHLSYRGMTCFVPMIRFIHHHIYWDNGPCPHKEHSPTIAIIELISSCRPTDCKQVRLSAKNADTDLALVIQGLDSS